MHWESRSLLTHFIKNGFLLSTRYQIVRTVWRQGIGIITGTMHPH